GFALADLKTIVESMGQAAQKANVQVVTGDTKVVPKGAADKVFINTSGVGLIPKGINVASNNARVGDAVILSGTMADHGATVLTQREGLAFAARVQSDSAALNHMVKNVLTVCPQTHVLRDPTRGGVGTALNEIAQQSAVGIKIFEEKLPVRPDVAGICELLGLDPLYVANEGKLLAFVPAKETDRVLAAITAEEFGQAACVIGEVTKGVSGKVYMQTRIGGSRIVDMLTGEQLPRIC
ncbi:MAG: hydrogenase expression/formation protein HypE, partial [Desulfobacterales bacterium]|nr:hydrogenase expression/formation protein HypE [Desulfobacterales bacterium]